MWSSSANAGVSRGSKVSSWFVAALDCEYMAASPMK